MIPRKYPKRVYNCSEPETRKTPCGNSECNGCRSVAIARRILKEYPLTDAWMEAHAGDKIYEAPAMLYRGPDAEQT